MAGFIMILFVYFTCIFINRGFIILSSDKKVVSLVQNFDILKP